jgi:hypothetical protein
MTDVVQGAVEGIGIALRVLRVLFVIGLIMLAIFIVFSVL